MKPRNVAQSEQHKLRLQAHHERFTGSTARLFTTFFSDEGLTSYATLVATVDAATAKCVLDIGCGDGTLLAELARRTPAMHLYGLDASSAELELARKRVPGASFVQADCTDRLPYPDESFDAVLSHLVMMLVGDIEATISEIHRVTRPGGTVSFLYDDLPSDPNGIYVDLMRYGVQAALQKAAPEEFREASDHRLYDHATLQALCARYGLAISEHRHFTVSRELTEIDAWPMMATSYPLSGLDEDARGRAREAIARRFRERFDERVVASLPLQFVKAHRL